MDHNGWQSILGSNSLRTANNNYWKAFANVIERLCADLIET